MTLKIKPLGNQVVIQPQHTDDWQKSERGVLARNTHPFYTGTIVAISGDLIQERELRGQKTLFQVQDTVWYEKAAREVEEGGVKYHIIPADLLVAIV